VVCSSTHPLRRGSRSGALRKSRQRPQEDPGCQLALLSEVPMAVSLCARLCCWYSFRILMKALSSTGQGALHLQGTRSGQKYLISFCFFCFCFLGIPLFHSDAVQNSTVEAHYVLCTS